MTEAELIDLARDQGYQIVKDDETDYYRFSAILWVEESGLFDTPAEAAQAVLDKENLP